MTAGTRDSSRNSLHPPPSFSGGSARADDAPPLSKIKLFDSGGGSGAAWAPGPRAGNPSGVGSAHDSEAGGPSGDTVVPDAVVDCCRSGPGAVGGASQNEGHPHQTDHASSTGPRLSSGTHQPSPGAPAYTVTVSQHGIAGAAAPSANAAAAMTSSLRKPTPPQSSESMGPPSARRSSLHRRCPSTGATEASSCGGVDLCPSTAPPSSSHGPGFRRAPGATPAIPMSALDLDGSFEAPTPSTGGLGSLRKRKLDMDAALLSSP